MICGRIDFLMRSKGNRFSDDFREDGLLIRLEFCLILEAKYILLEVNLISSACLRLQFRYSQGILVVLRPILDNLQEGSFHYSMVITPLLVFNTRVTMNLVLIYQKLPLILLNTERNKNKWFNQIVSQTISFIGMLVGNDEILQKN